MPLNGQNNGVTEYPPLTDMWVSGAAPERLDLPLRGVPEVLHAALLPSAFHEINDLDCILRSCRFFDATSNDAADAPEKRNLVVFIVLLIIVFKM